MAVIQTLGRWGDALAGVLGQRAAGVEGATGGQLAQLGHGAGDCLQALTARNAQLRPGGEQAAHGVRTGEALPSVLTVDVQQLFPNGT